MGANRSYRRAICALVVLACVLAGAAISGAAPLGTITEFTAVGSNNAQVRAGPDGNLWFTDRAGRIGQITPSGTIAEFTAGLNPGSQPFSLAVGPGGNLWFTDAGTTSAIGMINPATHAIAEFSAGLNAGSKPAGITLGPEGNLWFTDKGTGVQAIASIDPSTHTITKYSAGLNAGSAPGGINTGSDGNVWFTDQGTTRAMGRVITAAPAASVTAPSVTGTGGVNVAQTCGGDTWSTWAGQQPSRDAFGFDGYQWLLDGSPIAGATGTSYTPTAADAGHQLSCEVTATYALLDVTVSATSDAVQVKSAADQLGELSDAVEGVGPGSSLGQSSRQARPSCQPGTPTTRARGS
jgi:streptogramin lyase